MPQMTPAQARVVDPILSSVAQGYKNLDLVGSTDDVFMLFPAGLTEGSTSTGSGYMFKTTLARYTVGGAVGDLLPFTLDAEGRGAGA